MEEEEISNKKIITKSIENYTKAFDVVNKYNAIK